MLFKSSTTKSLWATWKKKKKDKILLHLKYHEQEVSSQPVSWQRLFSVLPFILTNSEKLGCFFHLLTLQAFSLGIPGAAVHHHMKMERGRIVKEWTGRNTETLPLAGSAPATQRICIHTIKDFVVFLLHFFCQFFFFLIKKPHVIPAKAGCAKLLFKNHQSVWLSFCRQVSYWSISH